MYILFIFLVFVCVNVSVWVCVNIVVIKLNSIYPKVQLDNHYRLVDYGDVSGAQELFSWPPKREFDKTVFPKLFP